MKNSSLLKTAAFLPLFVFLFAACSKDTLRDTTQTARVNQDAANSVTNSSRNVAPAQGNTRLPALLTLINNGGTITAVIQPVDARSSITLTTSLRGDLGTYTTDASGNLVITNLRQGIYSILVHPQDPTYPDVRIDHVVVTAGQTTDLGAIDL